MSLSAKRASDRLTRAVQEQVEEKNPTYNASGNLNGKEPDKNTATMTDGAY